MLTGLISLSRARIPPTPHPLPPDRPHLQRLYLVEPLRVLHQLRVGVLARAAGPLGVGLADLFGEGWDRMFCVSGKWLSQVVERRPTHPYHYPHTRPTHSLPAHARCTLPTLGPPPKRTLRMFSSPSSATVTMRTSDTASRSQSGLMQPTFVVWT
jgi:hypothetical protein